MLVATAIANRNSETGDLILMPSKRGPEIPWWQVLMMQNRCAKDISSMYSDPRTKAEDLLDAVKDHRLAIQEFSSISDAIFEFRRDALKLALKCCYDADSRMVPSHDDNNNEEKVRNAYGNLIAAIIPNKQELLWLLYKSGFPNNQDSTVRDREMLHNRGWYRLGKALIRAYLVAISTQYTTVCFRLGNGEDPDRIKLPYSVATWSQLAEVLDSEYKPQFGAYTTQTTEELEQHFSPSAFEMRYKEEDRFPTRLPIAELLMLAQHAGHIEKTLEQRDMLACLAQCHPNWQGHPQRAERRVAQSALAEILIATSLMPSEMILTTHPDSANLYISGGPAMDGAVAETGEGVDVVEINKAKVRAINMKFYYFDSRPEWGSTNIEPTRTLFKA